MKNAAQTEQITTKSIHPATRMGEVHLTVANIDRQIKFHEDILGMQLHWRDGNKAGLGAGKEDLLQFTEVKEAQRARRRTGLYHTAILVPTRWELANLLKRIAETQTPIQGMTNHHTHMAVYLPDAEGNGLELAWDFPREEWPVVDGKLGFFSTALDPQDVFSALADNSSPWEGLDGATRVGHVHLHVGDLAESRRFYHDILGFDVIAEEERFAAGFVSAGGYHHHIAYNIWNGAGAQPPSPNSLGLRSITIVLPSAEALNQVIGRVQGAGITLEQTDQGFMLADPAQNGVVLTVRQ